MTARHYATLPNLLSALRLCSVPIFVWLFVTGRRDAALIIYAVGALTDFFDGYIARRTGQITELGKLLDPLADRVGIVALGVALVLRHALYLWLAVAVIARDVLVLSLFPVLERRGVPRLQVNFVGKTATSCLFLGLGWLALGETSFAPRRLGQDIGVPFVIVGAVLYWVAASLYAREASRRLRAVAEGPS